MKKLYSLTAAAILLISSTQFVQAVYAKTKYTLTPVNMTSEPIWVHIKASHKNKAGQTRHDEETFQVAASGGTNNFTYARNNAGGLQVMDIYNYDPSKPAPKANALHTIIKPSNEPAWVDAKAQYYDDNLFYVSSEVTKQNSQCFLEGKFNISKNSKGDGYIISNAEQILKQR